MTACVSLGHNPTICYLQEIQLYYANINKKIRSDRINFKVDFKAKNVTRDKK